MTDRLSALVNLAAPPTAEGAGAMLAELRPAAIAQVTAWPDTTENTGKAIGELFDTVPGPVGTAIENGSVTVITTAFDLTAASYDAPTKSCVDVSCHLEQTAVSWGAPYRYGNWAECNSCHQY